MDVQRAARWRVQLTLRAVGEELTATFTNDSAAPAALAFWWNRRMRVVDATGKVIPPGPGPVLPCGVAEDLEIVEPGASCDHAEPLGCTQPAGGPDGVGWSYDLAPGRYRVTVIYQWPPPHGFTQHQADPREFRGKLESNEVEITVVARPRKKFLGLF